MICSVNDSSTVLISFFSVDWLYFISYIYVAIVWFDLLWINNFIWDLFLLWSIYIWSPFQLTGFNWYACDRLGSSLVPFYSYIYDYISVSFGLIDTHMAFGSAVMPSSDAYIFLKLWDHLSITLILFEKNTIYWFLFQFRSGLIYVYVSGFLVLIVILFGLYICLSLSLTRFRSIDVWLYACAVTNMHIWPFSSAASLPCSCIMAMS